MQSGLHERVLHPWKELCQGEDSVLARDELFSLACEKSYHGKVPSGLLILSQEFRLSPGLIVANKQGDEITLNGLDKKGMAEDFGPEVFARASSRHLLEKEEERFAGPSGFGEGVGVVRPPTDFPDFGRFFISGRGAGGEERSHERE